MAALTGLSLPLSAAAAQDANARHNAGHHDWIADVTSASANDYASPEVSNIAESMASRADLPAQTTNWNAG